MSAEVKILKETIVDQVDSNSGTMYQVPALEVKGVSKYFEGTAPPVVDNLSCSFAPGQVCAIIGPSGGGKSVLLKILAGVLQPERGEVFIEGGSLVENPQLISRVSLMFQEGALFDSMTVFENVAFPFSKAGSSFFSLSSYERKNVSGYVSDIISYLGLAKAASKYPAQLSGGMRRRASLARALVTKPDILLLDDPTSGLDPVASSVIMKLISELCSEYRPTTLIVSHDLRRLLPISERTLFITDGKIVFDGVPGELLRASGRVESFVRCRFC
jgi:phospholipid/cholesterol/gamma-HCH transport system ATP-binding protein